jgi:hypothetical protein
MIHLLSFLLTLHISSNTDTFDLARQSHQLEAVKISEPINMTGELSESAWTRAAVIAKLTYMLSR